MSVGNPDWGGIPAADRLNLIYSNASISLPDGVGFSHGALNVSPYHSLIFISAETNVGYTGKLPRLLSFYFYTDSSLTYSAGVFSLDVPCDQGQVYGHIPVLGPYLTIAWAGVFTTTTGTVSAQFLGSFRGVTKPRVKMLSSLTETMNKLVDNNTGTVMYNGTVSAGSSHSAFPTNWTGRMFISVHVGAVATTAMELVVLDLKNASRITGIYLPVSATNADYQLETEMTGEYPEVRLINGSSGSVAYQLGIQFEGAWR